MDAVRFGRALGFGARNALKTVVTAVDAATSEKPSAKGAKPIPIPGPPAPKVGDVASPGRNSATCQEYAGRGSTPRSSHPALKSKANRPASTRGLRRGTKRFGQAVWKPFVRLSGVLGLEVAGVFFGIFALFALGTVWRLRGDWHRSAPGHQQFVWGLLMLAVFGYFCVSSFVRARRREHGR